MQSTWAAVLVLLLVSAAGRLANAAPTMNAADVGTIEAISQGPPRRSLLATSCALSACFLMDQSGSMNAVQWAQVRSFAASSASVLTSRSKGASVYVAAKFDSKVETVVGKLTNNAKTFGRQVGAAKQNRQGTFTAAGLDRCRALLAGADERRPRVIILITDGQPTVPRKYAGAAARAAAKAAKAAGLTIFSVGVKDSPKAPESTLNPTLLRGLASRGQFFFVVNDFRSLSSAVQSVVPRICTATASGKYPADPTPKPAPKPSKKPSPKPTPRSVPKKSPPPPRKAPPPPPAVVCPSDSLDARFDDLSATTTGNVPVPTAYMNSSLAWANWNVWDAKTYQTVDDTSGFARGMVSPNNVAWNNAAQPASISSVEQWTWLELRFFWGTAGFPDGSPLTFNVTGYDDANTQVATATFTANVAQPTLFTLPTAFASFAWDIKRLEWVRVTQNPAAPSTKQQLVIDNLCLRLRMAA